MRRTWRAATAAELLRSIELDANVGVVGDPPPRERAIEAAEHFARLTMRVLVCAALVAGLPALTFGEIRYGICSGAPQLVGEMRVVRLELLDDGSELADDFLAAAAATGCGNRIRFLFLIPFLHSDPDPNPDAAAAAATGSSYADPPRLPLPRHLR